MVTDMVTVSTISSGSIFSTVVLLALGMGEAYLNQPHFSEKEVGDQNREKRGRPPLFFRFFCRRRGLLSASTTFLASAPRLSHLRPQHKERNARKVTRKVGRVTKTNTSSSTFRDCGR